MERHILTEGTSSCSISSSWNQGVPMLAPPCKPYRQRRPNAFDQLHIPHSTLDSDWTLNLTAWFSYHVVFFRFHTCSNGLPWRTSIPLFTNHNVTWGHQEWTQNSCQQSLYDIDHLTVWTNDWCFNELLVIQSNTWNSLSVQKNWIVSNT